VDSIENILAQYKKWVNHVSKLEDIRYPKQLDYQRTGRPFKRLLDGQNRGAETSQLLA